MVFLTNGDRITCSVKQLDRGKLRVTTDNMGVVFIDWTGIGGVEAAKNFEVELENGEKHYGALGAASSEGTISVVGDESSTELALDSIVHITEIKRGFFRRLIGSIDFGSLVAAPGTNASFAVSIAEKSSVFALLIT